MYLNTMDLKDILLTRAFLGRIRRTSLNYDSPNLQQNYVNKILGSFFKAGLQLR